MQRITTASKRSRAMNYRCCCAIRAVRKNTHAGHDINRQPTDSAVTGMQRITPAPTRSRAMNYRCCCVRLHAMNYSYCCAIVRSEKTHTLAKYVYASKRSRAMNYRCMQWITAAAAPSCGQKKHTRWPRHTLLPTTSAAASSCMQWITATAAPSCGQKKHTRWRSTSTLRNDHVQWITAACNELQLLLRHPCGQKKHTRWPRHTLLPTT